MTFEYNVTVPNADGVDEQVALVFKPITKVPVGILRRHRHDPETQMWATFEWGLAPEDLEVFDRMPAGEIEAVLDAWQKSAEDIEQEPKAVKGSRNSKNTTDEAE